MFAWWAAAPFWVAVPAFPAAPWVTDAPVRTLTRISMPAAVDPDAVAVTVKATSHPVFRRSPPGPGRGCYSLTIRSTNTGVDVDTLGVTNMCRPAFALLLAMAGIWYS